MIIKNTSAGLITLLIIIILTAGCNLPSQQSSELSAFATVFAELEKTLTPIADETSVQKTASVTESQLENLQNDPYESLKVYFHPGLPKTLIDNLEFTQPFEVTLQEDADLRILIGKNQNIGSRSSGSHWIYALVAPFYTITDGIDFSDLTSLWQGNANDQGAFSRIVTTNETRAALQDLLGQPDDRYVETTTNQELTELALTDQPVLSVLPFEDLDPQWKVLRVDGLSPISDRFTPEQYALTMDVWVEGPVGDFLLPTNYDPELKTVLVMTGVTALTRATAYRMAVHGNQYPGRDVVSWFLEADLVHINNEVPFAENCPFPDPFQSDLIFCSSPDRIELLEYIGANIIELSGNHMLDYGVDAMNLTLEMYAERGWQTYAGGWDLMDSRLPELVTHNGNQLAFIGCNPAGPPYSWAADSRPGSTPCGDYQWMINEIRALRSSGYLPIVTLQYIEDYTAYPSSQMVADFQRLADAGAIMVSGSQAHTPKTMVFYDGSFLHFGLGNLFFDQMHVYYSGILMQGTREAFLDRMIFYNGRLISIELLTTMLEDYARPRPMSDIERYNLLSRIFEIAVKSYD